MRIVVLGATGNVGTSVLESLGREDRVGSIVGIARRVPALDAPKVEWRSADVASDDLAPHFAGADCVIHLAWLIQPSRDLDLLWRVNVEGSTRVFRAAAEVGVGSLVYASSIGAYSPARKDRAVDETWPTNGVRTSFYARHKVEVERRLDSFEREHPEVRVVRMRPAVTFKRESATEQRRLFAGPFLPTPLVRPGVLPFIPDVAGLRFQAVHSDDVAEAYRLAAVGDLRGPVNVAADPVLDPQELARIFETRTVRMPRGLLRGIAAVTWRLRLQPSPPGWVDMALSVPIMDTTRARSELGWEPRHSAVEAMRAVAEGIQERAGLPTPPLAPDGPGRLREIASRVGGRE
jgi:nucleoside-diphosphate-sugar epimerase